MTTSSESIRWILDQRPTKQCSVTYCRNRPIIAVYRRHSNVFHYCEEHFPDPTASPPAKPWEVEQ